MAVQRIIIETCAANGSFRAEVVRGPKWVAGYNAKGADSAIAAYMDLSRRIMSEKPNATFEFIHAAL